VLSGGFTPTDLYPSSKVMAFFSGLRPKLEKMHQRIDELLDDIIQEQKTHEDGKGDVNHLLADALLKLQQYGNLEVPLTIDNIKAIILVSNLYLCLSWKFCSIWAVFYVKWVNHKKWIKYIF